ncbi:guanosine monophosphate reductase [Simkania sp.]|uniref:guanosine monophosphate reductase n=1 Tax=Simkania sp. TaxID=34094 RepID=UPI003B52F60C
MAKNEEFNRGYTFDDVCLVPQFNNVPSRTEPSLESWLTKNRKVGIPLLCSSMDTAISPDLAAVLVKAGSVPIYHRFTTDSDDQRAWVKKWKSQTFVSCGVREDQLELVSELFDLGAAGVCVDVAHGHSEQMLGFVEKLKTAHPDKEVIAGNVCTPMAYHDLVNAGADAVKVGIGPGAACTTRVITGFGVPQFTAIYECAQIAEKLRVPLIADGGIRTSKDVVLALAAGASTVMIGKLFALTDESAAEKRSGSNGKEAKYRGQASEDFQTDFYGGLKEKTVAEGVDFWGPVSGSAQRLLDELLGGLRSGLTYGGARSIKELQRKAEFMAVSSTYVKESFPRPGG